MKKTMCRSKRKSIILFLSILCLLFYGVNTYAQNKAVNRKITDSKKEALIGVNVIIKGTQQETVTAISTDDGITRAYGIMKLLKDAEYKISLKALSDLNPTKEKKGYYIIAQTLSEQGKTSSPLDTLFNYQKVDGVFDPYEDGEIYYTPNQDCYLYLYTFLAIDNNMILEASKNQPLKEYVDDRIEAVEKQDSTAFINYVDTSMPLNEILAQNGLQHKAINSIQSSDSYTGEKILLKPYKANTYNYKAEVFMTESGIGNYNGNAAQGFTIYGDVGFIFYDKGFCRTVDLINKKTISVFESPGDAQNPRNHAGQANFGTEFHTVGDEFPVLYLSSYLEKKTYVYRMTRTSAELVQTIYITDGIKKDDEFTLLDAQAMFIDNENDKAVFKMGGVDANGKKYKYWKVFDMPTLDLGEVVYLLDEKKIDEFYIRTLKGAVSDNINFYNAGFAMNGKIYVCAGFKGATSTLLVIDYEKKRILTDINWSPTIITKSEQEQCCYYKGSLMINFAGADKLVRVTF